MIRQAVYVYQCRHCGARYEGERFDCSERELRRGIVDALTEQQHVGNVEIHDCNPRQRGVSELVGVRLKEGGEP